MHGAPWGTCDTVETPIRNQLFSWEVRMNASLPAKIFNVIPKGLALFLVLMPLANPASAAAKAKPRPAAATNVIPLLPAEEFNRQEEWRNAITTKPQPKKGFFTAKFPS